MVEMLFVVKPHSGYCVNVPYRHSNESPANGWSQSSLESLQKQSHEIVKTWFALSRLHAHDAAPGGNSPKGLAAASVVPAVPASAFGDPSGDATPPQDPKLTSASAVADRRHKVSIHANDAFDVPLIEARSEGSRGVAVCHSAVPSVPRPGRGPISMKRREVSSRKYGCLNAFRRSCENRVLISRARLEDKFVAALNEKC
jgi:hypothetical protein